MLQEKLELLQKKYAVDTKCRFVDSKNVEIGGKIYPLLAHRFERRFIELAKLLTDGTINGVSVMRVCRIECAGNDLDAIIRREFDICRFISGSEFIEVTAFTREKDGHRTANIIAKLANGVVCTLETAATLPGGAEPVDKHEIIARQGIACDLVVDTQVPQSSIYVFADKDGCAETERYTDVDFELFGLSIYEIAAVRAAFALARDEDRREATLRDSEAVEAVFAAYKQSATSGQKVQVK